MTPPPTGKRRGRPPKAVVTEPLNTGVFRDGPPVPLPADTLAAIVNIASAGSVPVTPTEHMPQPSIPEPAVTPKRKATKPWLPANRLTMFASGKRIQDSKYMDPVTGQMYRGRYCSKAQLARKQSEGWEVDTSGYVTDNGQANVDPQLPLGTTKEKPDLVFCRMPEEMAQGREDYINQRTDKMASSIKNELDARIQSLGGKAYSSGQTGGREQMAEIMKRLAQAERELADMKRVR